MIQTPSRSAETATAPQGFRDALAELVEIGMSVARMVERVAKAETALADAAAQADVAEGVSPLATSLAEAIESDRAAAAAAEARHSVVARTKAVAAAFDRVARAIRLTMAMAERFDRGWAPGGQADDRHAMARRQIARGVADAVARAADSARAEQLRETLTEREALDWEYELANRSAEEIIAIICRALRLDPVRMTIRSPLPGVISPADMEAVVPPTGGGGTWAAPPPPRRPDG